MYPLCVTLPLAMKELRERPTADEVRAFVDEIKDRLVEFDGLRRLLTEIGWVWPVTVSFTIDFMPERWPQSVRQIIRPFFEAATAVIRDPEPSTKRRLFFDLKNKSRNDNFEFAGDELQSLLGSSEGHPFDAFKLLVNLHQQGLIEGLDLTLRKTDPDEILLFDELSDGEQMYLGRMALFHLMQGHDDALLLLDEPETHFNDKWKREIVDIIDDVLKDTANDILIATHSAITLTDVFNDEIILLENVEGNARRKEVSSATFGADPSEIMINVFETPDSIGKRSLKWLNLQLDRDWKPEEKEELEKVIRRIGAGLHRSELRALWRKLNASHD